MNEPFDVGSLRLDGETFQSVQLPRQTPPRHRSGELFLKGPVPWLWLGAAARLPGKALALSLCLWREAGRRRRRTVRLCLTRVGLGVNEQAARRALSSLQEAGLVSAQRRPGRGLQVTINDLPADGKMNEGHEEDKSP
jgi:hypothetical protein